MRQSVEGLNNHSALKFKEVFWCPNRATRGLGNRLLARPPAYSNSLRPTPAKVCAKPERWLE